MLLLKMLELGRRNIVILAGFGVLVLLAPSANSSHDSSKSVQSHRASQINSQKMSPELSFQIELHALLLWASVGFLMPVGVLIIRMSNKVQCGRKLKILFYSHLILQLIGVLLAIAEAALSIKNFENSFNNTHQSLGLALYALILVQPLVGFCRPHRGLRVRSIWYFVHWLLGTGVCILGTINIYNGLHAYHRKTSRSVRLWTILFTVEVALVAFVYLLQDRWDHLKKQGVILGDEQIRPTNHVLSPSSNQKESLR